MARTTIALERGIVADLERQLETLRSELRADRATIRELKAQIALPDEIAELKGDIRALRAELREARGER